MGRIKRTLRHLICKILNIQYRPELSEYELVNIQSHDAKFYICVDRHGIFNIGPGGILDGNLNEVSAGRSLAYYLGREILDFGEVIEARLKKLEQSNAPKRTPHLDALTRENKE